jgi:hypothetical protein
LDLNDTIIDVTRMEKYIRKQVYSSNADSSLSFILLNTFSNMPSVTIGQHLINRLKEINIDTIFGVPGDFNMVSLMDIILYVGLIY